MKRITSILVCLVVYGMSIFGQSVQITGTVTSADDGSALPGVTVVVKGDPSTGTITTIDGKYEISAPSDAILVFNYVGMETQEVQIAGQTNISIAMTGSIEMEEVVVTAYGINKDRKALGYSASDFKSEELEKVNIVSATQALQGKAAGVSIASASGAPGASTRVLIRGLSSITQSNQPLYVIDGIVINNQYNNANSTQASTSVNRTVDFGNAASDINPEDIASISILKGAAATNLYGSRAANGVVIITTKSGRQGDKMQVKFSTAFSLDEVGRLPYYQDRFGQGWSGHFDPVENGSWGPVMDGEDRLFGNTVDNSRRLMPFEFQENGIRDVFDYGTTYTNSLSLSGGTEKSTYYASYTNTKQDGIVPGDVDLLNRNSFLLKASSGTDKTKVDFSANYTHKKINAIATGQGDDAGGGKTLYQELLQNPVSHYVPLYRDYKNKFDNLDNYFTPYAQNPYYIINENGNEYK
ncbi:MAG: TonB-dependent receptor plug domain-containing protein, partial [Bacteroidales bacterium]|nr:TonB-dependent receptor plug domain-containing protein [Bacteroidales bacterium]